MQFDESRKMYSSFVEHGNYMFTIVEVYKY